MNQSTCAVDGCDRRRKYKTYCDTHYRRVWKRGTIDLPVREQRTCSVEGCDKAHNSRGYCRLHYGRLLRTGTVDDPIRERSPIVACLVDGCDKPGPSRGYCHGHYRRLRIYGSPTGAPRPPEPPTSEDAMARVRQHVKTSDPNACWEWQGTINNQGYGALRFGGKQYKAHRFSYEIHRGPIPAGLMICHKCDNPPCVNPDHLYAGTARENSRDAVDRDRRPKGERIGRAVLTPGMVRKIRKLRGEGCTAREIAERFKVSKSAVNHVIYGRSWRHVA